MAQSDADVEPSVVANKILSFYEGGRLKEEDGIICLNREVIEW